MSRHARSQAPAAVLAAGGHVVRGFRGFLGVELPHESVEFFGTKAQVSVEGTVNGRPFAGLAFPTLDAAHFLSLNKKVRRRLGISEGDRLEFTIRRREPVELDIMSPELARALSDDAAAKIWWAHLQPGHRRTALRFIAGARSPEVRAWRASDVLRRAKRYFQKEGPFYPTREDQPFLSRRSGPVRRALI